MRNRFDQLGKKIGLSALGPCGPTVANDEIAPDARHADLRHEPDPARHGERARLGLLGRMASVPCLIEIFSSAPDEEETLACLGKLIAFRQRRVRDAGKRRGKGWAPSREFARPFLWVLSAGRPIAVLAALGAVAGAGWPAGVHFSPGVLSSSDQRARMPDLEGMGGLCRAAIVVASELPRDRSTLLVRLMAGGSGLKDAIADLSALPEDACEHAVASEILLALEHALRNKRNRTSEEQEFFVSTQSVVERVARKWRKEGIQEGRAEGLAEGRAEGLAEGLAEGMQQGHAEGRLIQARAALRRVLALRKLEPSPADGARIDECTDLAVLERWHDQALIARSAAEVLRGRNGTTRRRSTRSR